MQPWRTHVYVSCFEAKTRDHFIFECTDAAAKPLEEYYTANKSLRGCIFNAYRPKGASNAKVLIVTSPGDLTKINLPAAPDLVAALAVIWRLPRTAMANTGESAGRPAIAFDAKVLKSLHEPPDNEGDPIEFERHRSAMIAELTANPKPNGRTKRKC